MVQFYGTSRPQSSYVIEQLGQGAEGAGRVLGEQFRFNQKKGRIQEALGSLDKLTPEQRRDPLQMLKGVLAATAGLEDQGRMAGPLYDALIRQQGISASQGVAPPGAGAAQPPQQQAAYQGTARPSQVGGQQIGQPQQNQQQLTEAQQLALRPTPTSDPLGVGRPRTSTDLRAPQPLLSPQEQQQEAQRIAQQKTAFGSPTTWEQEMPSVEAENARREAYNKTIDAENKNILNYREKLGESAQQAYKGHVPADQQTEKDKKRFEKYYLEAENATEPERFDYARRKFDQLTAAREAVKLQPSRPNWLNNIARKVEGSDRNLDQAIGELQGIVKPLIDLGEYQEARDLLINDVGLGLDETERVIHPMSKEQIRGIDSIPSGKTTKLPVGEFLKKTGGFAGIGGQEFVPQKQNIETLKNQIPKLLEQYPDLDLIQVRNKLSKKNYDWREFSQAIQELDGEGKLNLNQDARNNIQYLYNPPVKGMMNIFKNILFGKE